MSDFVPLLGEKLRGPDNSIFKTEKELDDKECVGFYFSAGWEPTCQKYTELLQRKFKHEYKEKGMAIVLISQDCDESQFRQQHSKTDFLALPWSEKEKRDKLKAMCKVTDLPGLILFTPEADIYNYDARKTIKEAEGFPWIPRALDDMLEGPFQRRAKSEPDVKVTNKMLGLYFGAGWSKQCKEFTPILAKMYDSLKKRDPHVNFEIIYVSGDTSEETYKETLKTMPWCAITWANREDTENLKTRFNVLDIPHLVILDEDQETVLNEDAKESIQNDREGYEFPWKKLKASDRFAGLLKGLQSGGDAMAMFKPSEPTPDPTPKPFSGFAANIAKFNAMQNKPAPSPNDDDDSSSSSSDSDISCQDIDSSDGEKDAKKAKMA